MKRDESDKQRDKFIHINFRKILKLKVLGPLLILLVMILLFLVIRYFLNSERFSSFGFGPNGDSFGQIGDFFNGISTPILTTVAVILAYLSFRNQSEQLENQRIEASRQRIGDIFFQLLNLHNNIVESLEFGEGDKKVKGRSYFKRVYNEFINIYIDQRDELQNASIKELLGQSTGILDTKHKENFTHYYRNLFQLFKWIKNNEDKLTETEQDEYVNFIRAQLSHYEIFLLYFNTNYYGNNGDFNDMLNKDFNFFYKYHEKDTPTIIDSFLHDVSNGKKNLD